MDVRARCDASNVVNQYESISYGTQESRYDAVGWSIWELSVILKRFFYHFWKNYKKKSAGETYCNNQF